MKGFLILGKCLTLVFWWVVLLNLFLPMAKPFHALINLAGGTLLFLHLIEAFAYDKRLRGRSHPWLDRVQILLAGIFHIQSIPASSDIEATHA